MKFINRTQYELTEEQIKDLITTGFDADSIRVYPDPNNKQTINFYEPPSLAKVRKAFVTLANYVRAKAANRITIVGADYTIGLMEEELERVCVIEFHYELQAKQAKR